MEADLTAWCLMTKPRRIACQTICPEEPPRESVRCCTFRDGVNRRSAGAARRARRVSPLRHQSCACRPAGPIPRVSATTAPGACWGTGPCTGPVDPRPRVTWRSLVARPTLAVRELWLDLGGPDGSTNVPRSKPYSESRRHIFASRGRSSSCQGPPPHTGPLQSQLFAFRDTDRRCSSAQQSVQWFPPAARVSAASSAAPAALRQLAAELHYVCAVEAQHCSLHAAAHAHGARMVMH